MNTPDLFRTPELTVTGPGQYWIGGPFGNTTKRELAKSSVSKTPKIQKKMNFRVSSNWTSQIPFCNGDFFKKAAIFQDWVCRDLECDSWSQNKWILVRDPRHLLFKNGFTRIRNLSKVVPFDLFKIVFSRLPLSDQKKHQFRLKSPLHSDKSICRPETRDGWNEPDLESKSALCSASFWAEMLGNWKSHEIQMWER